MAQGQPKALYRKYRGLGFDDIIGQSHITDILQQAITHGRISHAYLFTGPRGVGKTSVARILAHKINNLEYKHEDNHIDIIEIDAASNRRIDEIRDLREKSHIAPVSATYKVYIIDEVHMLTKEAFNALLKTLEEPPEHVVFILATTEAHKLPATIISRTQRHTFRPIPIVSIVEHLATIAKAEKIKIDTSALEVIAEHADGSFRDAISLLDQASGMKDGTITEADVRDLLGMADAQTLAELLELTDAGNAADALQRLQALIDQGRQPELLALQLASHIRNQDSFYARLDLVESLLSVPSHNEPRMYLEITLLKHLGNASPQSIETPATAVPSETHSKKQSKKTPPRQSPVKAEESDAPRQEADAISRNSVSIDEKQWQQIITAVKTQNNAVASILRNSVADIDENGVSLRVKFAFHKKKLEGSQATEMIQSGAQAVCGGPIRLSYTVDTAVESATASPQLAEPEEDYSSTIIDTFGGGERVKI